MTYLNKIIDFIKAFFFFTAVALISLLALFAILIKNIFTK